MIILRHQTRKNFLPPDALFYTCSIASKRRLEISRARVCVQDDHLCADELIMLIRTQFFVVEMFIKKQNCLVENSSGGRIFFLVAALPRKEDSKFHARV